MFKKIELTDIDEKELLHVLDYNRREARFTKQELEKLKTIQKESRKIKTTTTTKTKISIMNEKESKNNNQDFEDEVAFYMETIRSVSEDELESDIEEYLPSKENLNYKNILMRIQIELLGEISELKRFVAEDLESWTKEEINEIKSSIKILKNVIKKITKIMNEKETISENNKQENRFIFMPTDSGNLKVLDDMEYIPNEYLESFKELFDSIKNNTFKNVRIFSTDNNVLSGVAEVKGFKTRVVFDRIGKHDYALITAFMKKSDNDRGYQETLKSAVSKYKKQKDKLKELLEDDEFIKLNEDATKELYNLLPQDEIIQEKKRGEQ